MGCRTPAAGKAFQPRRQVKEAHQQVHHEDAGQGQVEAGGQGLSPRVAGIEGDARGALLSPFLVWRVVLVSLLMAAAALAVFFTALGRGETLEYARTMVVNMIVVAEIFYLFNVRYLHVRSLSWRGALGTPAVLAAIAGVVAGQLAFTYAPFMQAIFDSRPLALGDGATILVIGAGLMLLLEVEKLAMRRFGLFRELRT